MALTDEIYVPEGQYDNGNMIGTKSTVQIRTHISRMSDERLTQVFTDFYGKDGRFDLTNPEYMMIRSECPSNINSNWLVLTLAGEAYMRDILDEDDYLQLQDEHC